MFIAIYRWTLKPAMEAQFETDWTEVTRAAIADGGSFGSALGRAADGSWVAVARWPSKEQRDEWFRRDTSMLDARARMRAAMERQFEDVELEVVNDYTIGAARSL